jgi:hypothetical protein
MERHPYRIGGAFREFIQPPGRRRSLPGGGEDADGGSFFGRQFA